MRKSIVVKVFVITVLFISLCLSLFMAGQTLFFEKIYLNMKSSRLEKSVEEFTGSYANENWDAAGVTKMINAFSNKNNAQIAILDNLGNTKYMPSFSIVLETPDKEKLEIQLNNIAFFDEFQKLRLAVGDKITADGYFDKGENQLLSVSSIKKGNDVWENSNIKLVTSAAAVKVFPGEMQSVFSVDTNVKPVTKSFQSGNITLQSGEETIASVNQNAKLTALVPQKIEGRIDQLNIPSQIQQIANYNNGLLWSSIDYWNQLLMADKVKIESDKTVSFHYSGINNGMDNIAFVKPVVKDNRVAEYVFAISSLQPVGEAVDAIQAYYLYAFLGVLLIMVLMALIFAKSISLPLLKMNRVAAKMADQDFSEQCQVKSKDELGSLASNLNRLSMNLSTSLNELKSANGQLQLDIEKERSLENMRKEFISSVSHEFKTPLGIIKGFAEGFKDNIAENKKDYYVDVILDEIEKMDELVVDLLDLSKLESKAYELKPECFPIGELIDEVAARLVKNIEEKNIRLKTDSHEEYLEVRADRRRIEQVITNIMSNAIRHTNSGGCISIGIEINENKLYVNIENTGEPIGEGDIKKIWDRFYRAEKSRDRKTGGTGLGLSIVKNILELHESRYGVENTPQGVKFYFTLEAIVSPVRCKWEPAK